jgi:EF-hand domain-containing protein 1
MASEFPRLPGYVPGQQIDHLNFKRRSANQQEKIRNATIQASPEYPIPKTSMVPKPTIPQSHDLNYMTTTQSTHCPFGREENQEQFQPKYVHLDRQVLRFFGYFKESVPESNLENYRVRELTIKLHLEDNSIEILETKQSNSGIPQGNFLARSPVHNSNGSGHFLNAYNFRVGETIIVHGKAIMVYDVDDYTRQWFADIHQPQPERQDLLSDNFKKYVTPKFHNKEWNGLNSSVLNGRVPCMKQFLNLDRKVLRFYVWSDIPYIMHYFLADDTMEVREINYANSGKDPFPLLLRRQRFPKSYHLNQPGLSQMDSFVKDSEIHPGMQLNVFGRTFRVHGCDPNTQDHYRKLYGVDFPLGDGADKNAQVDRG